MMDEKMMREVAKIVAEGSTKTMESLMFVLIALISELVEKGVLSPDDIERMFDKLEGAIRSASGEDINKDIPLTLFRRMRRILLSDETAG